MASASVVVRASHTSRTVVSAAPNTIAQMKTMPNIRRLNMNLIVNEKVDRCFFVIGLASFLLNISDTIYT
ncbi:hypothetical protein [Alkalihalobacillus hemicellulosilyticus]|uniref:hypothetical protein n=1 Tax=Halalkalibacter hemicellulosilyticus TaxID=127886 RepID=UPI001F1B22EE|nr:hypothetical protein [Halalkalibacter hemicellulosilyticus]